MKKHDSYDSYDWEEKEHGKGKGKGLKADSYSAWKGKGSKGDGKHKGGYRTLATYDDEYYGETKEEKGAYYWTEKDAMVSERLDCGGGRDS